jgi:uncharacterized protein YyaL (SSP411 family)
MKKLLFSLALVLATIPALLADWTADYKPAFDQARARNKLVLLYFTGSDWSPNCKAIQAEVFSQQSFKDFADKNYVMVTIDFPHQIQLSDDVKKQNLELAKKFDPHGFFPVLVVLTPDGKELGRKTGYKYGSGPDAIISVLKPFSK